MPFSTSGVVTTTEDFRELSDGNGVRGGPGTNLGAGPNDLIAFYRTPEQAATLPGVAQFVQPGTHSVATGTAGSTTAAFVNTTFTGAAGTSAYTVGDLVTALKALGLIAA
jgi:hypothetical protein